MKNFNNLVDLYLNNKERIDIISDQDSLFLIGFIFITSPTSAEELMKELQISNDTLKSNLYKFEKASLITIDKNDGISIAKLGKELIDSLDLSYTSFTSKPVRSGMPVVTTKDVAKRVAKAMGQKLYIVEEFVNSIFQALREIISEAESEIRIEIRDFGVFEVTEIRPKPKARNPRTGEIIYVPARRITHFKPGKLLKDILKKPLD